MQQRNRDYQRMLAYMSDNSVRTGLRDRLHRSQHRKTA